MGWSNGTYSRIHNWTADEAAAIDIEASRMDAEDDSIEAGINNCLTKDGQNEPTTNLPMGTNRHTGVGNAAALTDYASAADVIDQHLTYYVDSGAANAYVITPNPSIGAYAEGQKLVFRAANANTGASTLNVNALGAIAIQTNDGAALSEDMIEAGGYYEVIYDANTTPDRWVLVSPTSARQLQFKKKTSTETVTASTTLQADNDLTGFTLATSGRYKARAVLACQTQSSGGIKMQFDFSNAPNTINWHYHLIQDDATTSQDYFIADSEFTVSMTGFVNFTIVLEATFTANASTGGTMGLQWAQQSAVGNTSLNFQSWMEVEAI